MKIDRRSFISLIIGGGAGIALSPLPYKLQDDLSIWTQNWPWTPVPEKGEITYHNTVCSLCPGNCGITVRKCANRAVKIEGQEGYPVNDGGICPLGLAGLQLLYGPTRIKAPMVKTDTGSFKEISWEEAISIVAEKLNAVRKEGKPESVACISGYGHGTMRQLLKRFLTVFGSPNLMTMPSADDTASAAMKMICGEDTLVGYDLENANFILSFGSGIIEGWGSPVRSISANSKWKENKVKLIQLESRLSHTAAKADKWIPIKPGTEAALAFGIAGVIVRQGLAKVEQNEDFAKFKALVEPFSVEAASEITGVKTEDIVALAKEFASASRPLALFGRGRGDDPGSLLEAVAIFSLNALVGNFGKEGGIWPIPKPDYIKWSDPILDEVAKKGLAKKRVDGAGDGDYQAAESLINRFPTYAAAGKPYPISVLFVANANPLYSLTGTPAMRDALTKIPFIVSFSSYMDETAKQANLILPNHIFLERTEDLPAPAGFAKPLIGLAKPVVAPLYNTKHTGDVLIMLAKALKGNMASAFPWDSYEACLEQAVGPDIWSALSENGLFFKEDYTPPSLKLSLANPIYTAKAYNGKPLKKMLEVVSIEGESGSYPLTLMPYDSMRLAGGYIGTPPFLMKAVEDTVLKKNDLVVEVNPETVKGLSEGDMATLATPKGTCKVKIHLNAAVMPGVVFVPKGLGHTAYDGYLADKGVNVNELMGPIEDPVTGLDAAWGIRAKLS